MQKRITFLKWALLPIFYTTTSVYAQVQPQVQDTTRPPAPAYNAGFDVIIKKNGDIVYGLVQEVGLQTVKYQRTDIPNGPVYEIPKNTIYAISYRNQVKEIFTDTTAGISLGDTARATPAASLQAPQGDTAAIRTADSSAAPMGNRGYYPNYGYPYNVRRPARFQQGNLRLGLGFIRGYSKVSNAGRYSSSASFPIVHIAYDAWYRNQMRAGLQVAFGGRKFSGKEYSDYDSTQSDIQIRENIFTLHLYGKYNFLQTASAFRPYVLAGIGINTSNIRTEHDINFINHPDQVVEVKTGTRAVGVGLLARIGADYYFNNQFAVFGDVGFGPSVLQVGVSARLN